MSISPCIGVCEYAKITEKDVERICRGCFRTAEEIEEWYHASGNRKEEIRKESRKRQTEWEIKKYLTILQRTCKILKD
jgi:predicted Fe-S protein YdhL (DUF1289 family)